MPTHTLLPVVAAVRGKDRLPWVESQSCAEVQAGAVISLHTHRAISIENTTASAVAPCLTAPLTELEIHTHTHTQAHTHTHTHTHTNLDTESICHRRLCVYAFL